MENYTFPQPIYLDDFAPHYLQKVVLRLKDLYYNILRFETRRTAGKNFIFRLLLLLKPLNLVAAKTSLSHHNHQVTNYDLNFHYLTDRCYSRKILPHILYCKYIIKPNYVCLYLSICLYIHNIQSWNLTSVSVFGNADLNANTYFDSHSILTPSYLSQTHRYLC